MTDDQLIQVIRSLALPVILLLVVAIALRQLGRVYRHMRYGTEQPEILMRDVAFFWGLAFLFVTSAAAGALGVQLGTIPAWVALSSSIVIVLLAIFAWYEFVVIGRQKP